MARGTKLLIPAELGDDIPSLFASGCGLWTGILPQDHTVLMAGPTHPDYAETWEYVLEYSSMTDTEGRVWNLWHTCMGDLYAYCLDIMDAEDNALFGWEA